MRLVYPREQFFILKANEACRLDRVDNLEVRDGLGKDRLEFPWNFAGMTKQDLD